LYVASITEHHASIQKLKFFKKNKAQFVHKWKAAVSCGIVRTGSRNLAKFTVENCGPYRSVWYI